MQINRYDFFSGGPLALTAEAAELMARMDGSISASVSRRDIGDAAVVSVSGPMWPAVYEAVADFIDDAVGDAQAGRASVVILSIDSPGGTVAGCREAVARISEHSGVYAYVAGMACSGGYWLASACSGGIAGAQTVLVGSVGVRMMHVDFSQAMASCGIKITHITTGPLKIAGNSEAPLSDADRAYFQGLIDDAGKIFIADVTAARGLSGPAAKTVAQGGVFAADGAVDIGLMDKTVRHLGAYINKIGGEMGKENQGGDEKQEQSVAESTASGHAPQAAQADMIGLAAVVLGDAAAAKLKAAHAAGLTPDQLRAASAILGGDSSASAQSETAQTTVAATPADKILAALAQAHNVASVDADGGPPPNSSVRLSDLAKKRLEEAR